MEAISVHFPEPVNIKRVEFDPTALIQHNTYQYVINQQEHPTGHVVRRGGALRFTITTNRSCNENDVITFVMFKGEKPNIGHGTCVRFSLDRGQPHQWRWSAVIKEINDTSMIVEIHIPPNCAVGKWCLGIVSDTSDTDFRLTEQMDYELPIYILFNPWCSRDSVYMEDEILADECVLNDFGKIYCGNYWQMTSKPWNFGQFEENILDYCFELLREADLAEWGWDDPIKVIRAISGIICNINQPARQNTSETPVSMKSILVGNWSGVHTDGVSPQAWMSSGPILEQYMTSKEPVKYGQCFVFAAVATTICRCLGIPCRCVTNYGSAHDCDGTNSVNFFWTTKNELQAEEFDDHIWTFHVWNEAWVRRRDLPGEPADWQVFDPTLKQSTEGLCCSGPAPRQSIKDGALYLPFGGHLVFGDINVCIIHWLPQPNNKYRTIKGKHKTGRRIITKLARNEPDLLCPECGLSLMELAEERQDITSNYKHQEGSEQARAAIHQARTLFSSPMLYDFGEKDVKFTLVQTDNIVIGAPIMITLKASNNTSNVRTIDATVTLRSIYYHGVHKAKVKQESFNVVLPPIKSHDMVMYLTDEEYLLFLAPKVSFRIDVYGQVAETKQIHVESDDFRFRIPDVEFEVPRDVEVGAEFVVKMSTYNPLPYTIQDCQWHMECLRLLPFTIVPYNDVEPLDHPSATTELVANESGKYTVVACFNSRELSGITGQVEILVLEKGATPCSVHSSIYD